MEKGKRPLEEVGKFFGGLFGDAVESAKVAYDKLSELPADLEQAGKDIADAVEKGYNEGLFIKPDVKPEEESTEKSEDDKDLPSQT